MNNTNNKMPGSQHLVVARWQLAFLCCLLGCLALLALLPDNLIDFSDRAIGAAIVTNSDINRRLYVYILSLAALVAIFCIWYLKSPPARAQQVEQWRISVWALLGGCLFLNLAAWFLSGFYQPFLQGVVIASVLCAAKLLTDYRSGRVPENGALLRIVCISWQVTLIIFFTLDLSLDYWFIAAWVVMLAGAWVLQDKAISLTEKGAAWPLRVPALLYAAVMAPLLYVAAVEIAQLGFHSRAPMAQHGYVFAALVVAVVIAGQSARLRDGPGAAFCALCVLVSTTLLQEYDTRIVYRFFDVFHLGERVLPLQQWSSFGLLPYLDYMPPHGLADVLPQMVYQLLARGDFLEAMIWGNGHFMGWLPRAAGIALLFYFFCRLLPVPTAFFLIWLLPTYHLFEPYYTLFLFPALHILRFDEDRNTMRWWMIHWLLVLLLFFWRPDFGIAAIAGSGILAVVVSVRSGRGAVFVQALVSAVAVAAPACLALLFIGEDQYPDRIALMRAYIGNQIPVAALPRFYHEIGYSFIVQYIALPSISALVLARTLVSAIRRDTMRDAARLDATILFLSAVSLVLSLRSLQRHSLFEGDFNTYLHLFVALLFLIRQGIVRTWPAVPLLCGFLATGSYLVLPAAENFLLRRMYHPAPALEYPLPADRQAFHKWKPAQPRLVKAVDQYAKFERLMGFALAGEQTFYDFTNAPLLYTLADARLPTYFTQTAFQTSDTIQKHVVSTLAELRDNHRLPLVTFRQNVEAFDRVDGVDNALRSYLIAEFIYANYVPCIEVSRIEIWIDRDLADAGDCRLTLGQKHELPADLLRELTPLREDYLKQFIDYGYLPLIWARADKLEEATETDGELAINPVQADGASLLLEGEDVCDNGPCYLDLAIRSDREQDIVVNMFDHEILSFTLQPGEHLYRLRVSVLWDWHRLGPARRFDLGGDAPLDVLWARLSKPLDAQ